MIVAQETRMPDSEHRLTRPDTKPPRPRVVAAFLVCAWVLMGTGLALSGRITSRADYDQKLYHLAAIRQFAQQWPDFDFWHYMSATTPGYHLLMAAVMKFVSPSLMALQAVAIAIAGLLLGLLGCAVGRRTTPLLAAAFCLPLLCNMYVVDSGAWLLPDDLGWVGVLAILLIALRPKLSVAWMLAGGVILLGLVFVRQSHLWAAAMLWASSLGSPGGHGARFAGGQCRPRAVLEHWRTARSNAAMRARHDSRRRIGRALLAVLGRAGPTGFSGLVSRGEPFGRRSRLRDVRRVRHFFPAALVGVSLQALEQRAGTGCCRGSRRDRVLRSRSYQRRSRNRPAQRVVGCCREVQVPHHRRPHIAANTWAGRAGRGGLCSSTISAASIRQRFVFLVAIAGFIAASSSNSDLFQQLRRSDGHHCAGAVRATAAGHTPKPGAFKAAGPLLLAAAFFAMTASGIVKTDCRVNGPNPPSRTPSQWDSREVPCDMPRPPMPPGKHFWP